MEDAVKDLAEAFKGKVEQSPKDQKEMDDAQKIAAFNMLIEAMALGGTDAAVMEQVRFLAKKDAQQSEAKQYVTSR